MRDFKGCVFTEEEKEAMLLELLRDADRKLDTGEITIGEYEKMIAPLNDAVLVVHGHWIEVNDSYNRISGRCSVCGWESHMYEDDVVGMEFCPNCGARLDGKDGDNHD